MWENLKLIQFHKIVFEEMHVHIFNYSYYHTWYCYNYYKNIKSNQLLLHIRSFFKIQSNLYQSNLYQTYTRMKIKYEDKIYSWKSSNKSLCFLSLNSRHDPLDQKSNFRSLLIIRLSGRTPSS